MATRECSYCLTFYTDEEGPHPRQVCLDKQLAKREQQLEALWKTQRNIRKLRLMVSSGKEI